MQPPDSQRPAAVCATAPCRVDLAGGTLDLWPLGLFVPDATTLNVAIDVMTGCTIRIGGDAWCFSARGLTESWSPRSLPERPEDEAPEAFKLAALAAQSFVLPPARIETWSDAPRGSGLGASSALMIALIAACSRLKGRSLETPATVQLACNLETRILRLPAGTQDHWSARCGGASILEHGEEGTRRTALPADMRGLAGALVVADTGVSHHSGQNNWTVYRGFLEGDPLTRTALVAVALAASELKRALLSGLSGDALLVAAGNAMRHEWEARRQLSSAVSCPEIEAVVAAARSLGGAAKVCGAGGGGCVASLPARLEDRPALVRAIEAAGARVLPVSVVGEGVRVEALDF